MASVIDDIYDSYGTLELFTNAIERWNVSCMDQLPEYMKLCYEALLDVYEEIEEEMAKQGNSYRVHYAKEAFEQRRGHVASAVECYMKQHGVSKQQLVHDEFHKQVADAWKDIGLLTCQCLSLHVF
uniref:Putative Terpene synthase 21 isoform 3 n=1 Tax=Davidia involucrata TaxID=16924 RepID=A0A5B7AU55_DAVIN